MTLAAAGGDRVVRIWDPAARKELRQLKGHTGWVAGVGYAPDGLVLASAGWDKTVRLWDLATGKEKAVLLGHTDKVNSVAFAPDGKTLASAGYDGMVLLWDAANGKVVAQLPGHTGEVNQLAFTPDGNTLASTGGDQTVRLWDVAARQEVARLRHSSTVYPVTFSPDGATLVSAGFDKVIRLWHKPNPIRYTPYLSWCEFRGLDLKWKFSHDIPDADKALGFVNVPAGSHLSFLHRAKSVAEADRALFASFLAAGNVDGARLLIPRQPLGPSRDDAKKATADQLRRFAVRVMDGKALLLAGQRLDQARELAPTPPENDFFSARLVLLQAAELSGEAGEALRPKLIDQALTYLERAVQQGLTDWRRLQDNTVFKPLHGQARYQKTLEASIPADEWVARARALQRKDPAQARLLCEKALARDPKHAGAYTTRGYLLARKGDFEPALADFRQAVAFQQDDPWGYYNLACGHSLRAASRSNTRQGDMYRHQDIGRALDALEQAAQKGWSQWDHLKKDADLAPLRGHPRYQKLIQGR